VPKHLRDADADLLGTAVVDITTLVATCRALRSDPLVRELDVRRKPLRRLRAELRRASVAYVDTLARSKRGVMDDELLASCRAAAEREMPQALRHQQELKRMMSTEPGALAGVAAARQDLWRLAHMAMYLRQGVAAMHDSDGIFDDAAARKMAGRLRRRLRRALIAYALVGHRSKEGADKVIVAAREAALGEIGKRGAEEADNLGRFEARGAPTQSIIAMGVVKPLYDLVVDWSRLER
jgi:hypothetical protein